MQQEDKKDNRSGKNEEWKILTTVANDIEFEMLSGLLATAEIPCVRKVRGVDGYLQVILGVPIAGIDVLVPQDRFEEAQLLLEAQVDEKSMEE